MSSLIERLLSSGPIVTDGAWGTQLQASGLSGTDCPDAWNLTHPEHVARVPQAYVAAGSQVILTNTFRANRLALDGYGLADQVRAINLAGAEISRRAAQGQAHVFGSIGPTGKLLLTGDTDPETVRRAFAEQAEALAAGGVDGLVVETMSDLAEAELALGAARATGLPVVVCVVFDSGRAKDRTMMGQTAAQAARELTDAGADVVGANCGQGIEGYLEICRQLRAATPLPLWLKPNAGTPELIGDRVVYRATAADFAAHAPGLIAAGANFLGGCCGTGPDFIEALRQVLRP